MKYLLCLSVVVAVAASALTLQKIATTSEGASCNNTADLGVFKEHASDFHTILQKCATSTLGDAGKTASCLAAGTGLSAGCSICFGTDAHCVAANCIAQCFKDPKSSACLQCNQEKCEPALLDCAGVPANVLPKAEAPHVEIEAGQGSCNDTADLKVFKDHADDFHSIIQKCATSTLGDAGKTAKCLAGKTGLSSGCSICFGADAHCAAAKCIAKCFKDPKSSACLQCNQEKCEPALLDCAGVPAGDLPN